MGYYDTMQVCLKGHIEGAISFDSSKPPLNCYNCGKSHPWRWRLSIREKLKKPKWLKPFGKWLGKNLVKVVMSVAIAVITAVILFKMGIEK